MSEKRVNPVHGKYSIPGKNNRNLELTLDDQDLNKYIVEELDGNDMTSKLPSSNPQNITWFACFSIYKNKDDRKNGYAKVKYSFTVNMDGVDKLFVAYGGNAYDVTGEVKKNGKVTLSEGDPATGTIP